MPSPFGYPTHTAPEKVSLRWSINAGSPACINTLIFNMRRKTIKAVSRTTFDKVDAYLSATVLEFDDSAYRAIDLHCNLYFEGAA